MSTTEKLTKPEWDILFKQASDAIDLMTENPHVLRAVVDLFKKGKFSEVRTLLNRRLEGQRAAAASNRVCSDGRKK